MDQTIIVSKKHLLTLAFKSLERVSVNKDIGFDDKDLEYLFKCIQTTFRDYNIPKINFEYDSKNISWKDYYELILKTCEPTDVKRYNVRRNVSNSYSSKRIIRSVLPREHDDYEDEQNVLTLNQEKTLTPHEELNALESEIAKIIIRYDFLKVSSDCIEQKLNITKQIVHELLIYASQEFLKYFLDIYFATDYQYIK